MKELFKISLTIVTISLFTCGYSQNIIFSDLELKQYLVNENCVDTTNNGLAFSNDVSVDRNGDKEIQVNEALEVEALELNDFPGNYAITSLLDLNEFANLRTLKIVDLDSLKRFSNLNLDSLKILQINGGKSFKTIDVSNLPELTKSIRIEGVTTLDTLNTKNGTAATQFSLFYSQNIKYACIDSIQSEIDEFSNTGAMMFGLTPSFTCGILNNLKQVNDHPVHFFPIPADTYLKVEYSGFLSEINIFTSSGKKVLQTRGSLIDISGLSSGIYTLQYRTGRNYFWKKIIVE